MSELDDIEDGEGGDVGDPVVAIEPSENTGDLVAGACLSCGAGAVGVFCANCGQKNDDLRRSLLLLGRDFIEDTFSFDSRMWRTLGALAVAPGIVPGNYAHGRRSLYTPPVRLFLVVSFLFFLAISFTQTMFVAVEITRKPPEQIAQEAAAREQAAESLGENGQGQPNQNDLVFGLGDDQTITVPEHQLDCQINVNLRLFLKAKDINIDQKAWRACADSIRNTANKEYDEKDSTSSNNEDEAQARSVLNQIINGISKVIEDPLDFNAEINNWLPRVMFFMAPIAALLMGVFIRGPNALFFDHMVMSLYSHAVAFALAGTAIVLTQIGISFAGIAAFLALFMYSVLSLKRVYGRGWVKTIYSTLMVGALYLFTLVAIVTFIVTRFVLQA